MLWLTEPPKTYMGLPIVVTPNAFDRIVDWSCARSPSRAKRRYAKGRRKSLPMRENPVMFMFQGTLIVHPDLYRQLILASEIQSI